MGKYVQRAGQLFFRREHPKQLTQRIDTGNGGKLRERYKKITINNRNSLKPTVFIEPVCSKINYGKFN